MSAEFRLRWMEVVRAYPEKTAVVASGRSLSYEELAHRAGRYAAGLVGQGLRGQCIAVPARDPIEHVAALIGVLLSGNYYYSTTDGPTLLPPSLPAAAMPAEDWPAVGPDEPFCLFTTSGSTGPPKQVVHSHASVMTDTLRQIADNRIQATDRIDQLFSFEFSASLACVFPALLSGATLVLYDLKTEGVLSLPGFWKTQRITFSSLSVSTFRALLKSDTDFRTLPDLRMLSVGAEPVRPEDIAAFQSRFGPQTTLQVAYATTETRTISEQKIRTDSPAGEHLFSVGRPVAGRTVTIRSETGAVLPVGEVGEIVVRARHIPAGYANHPEATRKAYEVRPDGEVVYATGDLGYFDADGFLYWCGRTDFMVKINGQKVSLIQLENELKREPGVRDAAVTCDTAHPSRPRLNAFLCVEPGFDLPTLKQSLAQRLPLTMLPDRYAVVEALPRTKTGKLDRPRLPALPETGAAGAEADRSAEGELGRWVARIKAVWQKELALKAAPSDYDDFFTDLGGDSLTAESSLAELENGLGIILPAHAVFSFPTPKALAYFLAGHRKAAVRAIPLNPPDPTRRDLYFIPPLPGDRRMYGRIENRLHRQYNLYFVHYEPFSPEGELLAFPDLIGQVAGLITRPAESVLLGFSFGGLLAYQVALALEQAHRQALHRLVLLDTPLYRRVTFRESLRKDVGRIGRKVAVALKGGNGVGWGGSLHRAIDRYRSRLNVGRPEQEPPVRTPGWQEACGSAVRHYVRHGRVTTPIGSPILLFRASDSSAFQYEIRPDFRWRPFTTGGFEEHVLEADHDQVLNAANSYHIGTVLLE
ncbi:AMP-binding protein [Larkinella soli]|uniref:AMP-binding protein n=1 Tax=Larkinella soli TaxID=1770527 RepID=UPI000FFB7FD1|nr:AMP-binding protein [Larkinella soli]